MIDQKTGEILALANYPTFDPDRAGDSPADVLTDRAIQTVYSPGSVFKLITYGSALEKHLITPEGQVDAGNGSIEVASHRFSDHHTGVMSYSEALAHSSNVCAIKTGMRVGKADFYSMVQHMGFGRRTGIELPAETAGIVRSPEKWNGDSLASMSIGYEIGVTALQMATAFATIANDGIRVQPHLIKEIRQQDESVLSVVQPVRDQVVTADTARSLRTMLRQVVLTGTGRLRSSMDIRPRVKPELPGNSTRRRNEWKQANTFLHLSDLPRQKTRRLLLPLLWTSLRSELVMAARFLPRFSRP